MNLSDEEFRDQNKPTHVRATGSEKNGNLVYNLHKITDANGGGTNPTLLVLGSD